MRLLTLFAIAAFSACATTAELNPSILTETEYDAQIAARFQYPPPSPAAGRFDDPRSGRIADAAYFAAFPDYERAYSPRARARARALARQLAADAGDLSTDELTLRVSEIVALADNAHSHTGTAFQKNTRRVRVRSYWFEDGLFVLRAAPDLADLLGARIDAIDGIPIEQVYQRIRHYNGGTDIWRRQALTPFLESPGLLQAAGVTADPAAVTYSGILATGERFARRLEGEERGQAAPISSTARLIFPFASDSAMPSLLSRDADLPVYLRSYGTLFYLDDLPDNGLYVGLGFTSDTDEEPIAGFLARTTARLTETRPNYAVLDLRTNSGGDLTTTYDFGRDLPARVEHVYVLISGWTLSAAMHLAAIIEQTAPDRVTLVGAPVGDRMSFWSEGGRFVLPNTPLIATYTAGRHNFAAPCDDLEVCFWLTAPGGRFHVETPTLDPDISAPLTFAAYRSLRDPAMEAVAASEARRRADVRTR